MSRLFRLFCLHQGFGPVLQGLFFAVLLAAATAPSAFAIMPSQGSNIPLSAQGVASAVGSQGEIFFSFFDSASSEIHLGRLNAGSWSVETVAGPLSAFPSTALVVTDGKPHVFYYASGTLVHGYKSDIWQTETLDTGLGSGGQISSALCGSQICLSYYDAVNGDLKVLVGSTGTWQRTVVDTAGQIGSMSQIASSVSGQPVVAYYDQTNQRPKVAQRSTGGTWAVESISYLSRRFGVAPSIAVGADGTIHVASSRSRSSATRHEHTVYYARKAPGRSWEVSEAAEDYAGGATSISLGTNGLPIIAYARLVRSTVYGDNSEVEVASLLPTGLWLREQLSRPALPEAADFLFRGLKLAIFADGTPIISYSYDNQLSGTDQGIRVHGAAVTSLPDGPGSSSSSSSGGVSSSSSLELPSDSSSSSSSSGGTGSSSSSGLPVNYGPDTDNDGTPDSSDSDDDNDGLSDVHELALGTNPLNANTDGDANDDGQEVLDGSNPRDRGSVLPVLNTTICTEWNGFLDMWNIFEQVNLSAQTLNVETTVYDISGTPVSISRCDIAPGAQCDVLVHDMPGRAINSYGKVCAAHNGSKGDLDGRMVYYRQKKSDSFEFAFAGPLSNGRTGAQSVPFNTYQPSAAASDANNMVANWIQLTNLGSRDVSGTLTYYSSTGAVLARQSITLAAGARRDFSGHQFGTSLVGQAVWEPADRTVPVQMRNVRYLYDNAGTKNSFTTAFQVDALVGSGETLGVALDTRRSSAILEIINNKAQSVSAAVSIYDASGVLKGSVSIPLAPYGSYHLITDPILGAEQLGTAVLRGTAPESISAVAMEYRRTSTGGIEYVYGLPAQQALGTVLSGSYNTFLSQESSLLLINPTGSAVTVYLSVTRSTGSVRSAGTRLDLPANGIKTVDLRSYDSPDQYGVVAVQAQTPNSVISWVNRIKGTDYVMPTPVRQ